AAWAKKKRVDIQRYSIEKYHQQFQDKPVSIECLITSGSGSLPLTLLEGQLEMAGQLPTREAIARGSGIPRTQDWREDSTQPRC
ncbi:arsenic metallochaperone ArsD family protein, partial [Salmonella enterica subsp. enterica serovar Infantis]